MICNDSGLCWPGGREGARLVLRKWVNGRGGHHHDLSPMGGTRGRQPDTERESGVDGGDTLWERTAAHRGGAIQYRVGLPKCRYILF